MIYAPLGERSLLSSSGSAPEVISTVDTGAPGSPLKTRPLRLRGGGAWQGLEGGKRGVGGGIVMSSIGGLNFPAVWGVASGGPGNQRL